MAGIAIVLFALMGTIGVGYLLNGSSTYETVNDYDYVTDVSGLYEYTPVSNNAAYSPAQNNYQYSETLTDLGTYTSGINYTEAGAANLNPIITPESGLHTATGTLSFDDLPGTESRGYFYMGSIGGAQTALGIVTKTIPLADLAAQFGTYTTATITVPASATMNYSKYEGMGGGPPLQPIYSTATVTAQPIGISITAGGNPAYAQAVSQAIYNKASACNGITTATANFTYNYHGIVEPGNYQMTTPVGVVSDIVLNANGTVTYTYTIDDVPTAITQNISDVSLIVWEWEDAANWDYTFTGLTWNTTYYANIEYMDPNQGVSLSRDSVYWSNGNDIAAATWAFRKPAASSTMTVTGFNDGDALTSFTVRFDTSWKLIYTATDGVKTVDLGSGWQGIYVRMFYTGELQAGPIDSFFNFTSYVLGPSETYATSYSGNVPIEYCSIAAGAGSAAMRFACIGTTVQSGTVPGAMFDATFNVASYFPEYQDVRISLDSAAYVGTAVQVGSWTMTVDSVSFLGTFQDSDGREFRADLTQPWAITWNPGADTVSITFQPWQQAGTQTVTILEEDAAKTINLLGLWAIDTDLYKVGTHVEEVYDWNFGNWGLEKNAFIVCAMGLTALLAIAFKLASVPFKGLDYVVIFFANVILWVIM